MTEPDPVHPSQIDRHIQRVLSDEETAELPLVHETLHESRDRWYGQIVVNVYETLSDRQNHFTTEGFSLIPVVLPC